MNHSRAKEVIDRHRARLMALPGVQAVAYGLSPRDRTSPRILVYSALEDWPPGLPHELEGYVVELVRSPKGFRALDSPQ